MAFPPLFGSHRLSAVFVRQLAVRDGRNLVGLVDVVVGGNKMVWMVGIFSPSPSCSGALPTPLFRRFWLTFTYSTYHCVVVVVNRLLFQPVSVLSLGCACPLYEVRRAFNVDTSLGQFSRKPAGECLRVRGVVKTGVGVMGQMFECCDIFIDTTVVHR